VTPNKPPRAWAGRSRPQAGLAHNHLVFGAGHECARRGSQLGADKLTSNPQMRPLN
jgi:hypothetical protein